MRYNVKELEDGYYAVGGAKTTLPNTITKDKKVALEWAYKLSLKYHISQMNWIYDDAEHNGIKINL